jgi:prepilin-type N-terminal cleavage/methylation domain-containing protein
MRRNETYFDNLGEGGFSVVEVMLVVVISVILAGIAVPYYQTIAATMRASGDLRDISGVTV